MIFKAKQNIIWDYTLISDQNVLEEISDTYQISKITM